MAAVPLPPLDPETPDVERDGAAHLPQDEATFPRFVRRRQFQIDRVATRSLRAHQDAADGGAACDERSGRITHPGAYLLGPELRGREHDGHAGAGERLAGLIDEKEPQFTGGRPGDGTNEKHQETGDHGRRRAWRRIWR